MDDILLTKEELEKQRELFDYEMTQVILNLEGKYAKFDRNNSPIKDSKEFADEVLGRHLDFEPLSDVEADIKAQNIPSLGSKPDYTPLTDVKPVVGIKAQDVPSVDKKSTFTPLVNVKPVAKIKADEKEIAAAKNTLRYKKHKKPQVVFATCTVPAQKSTVEYTPFAAEITVPVFENEMNSGLFTRRGVKYTPITDAKAKTKDHVLPRIGGAVEFSPFTDIAIADQAQSIPNIGVSAAYTPNTEIEIKPVSNARVPAVSIQYTALNDVVKNLPIHDVPSLKTTPVYSPMQATTVKKTKKKIPSGTVSPKFVPLKPVEITHPDNVMPSANKRVEFMPLTNPVEDLPKIESPKIGKTPDFEPVKISSVTSFTGSVPATKLDVKFAPKKAVKTKMRPIDAIPVELIAPKDFYAMWESL
jgi:hypothetical protein